MKKSVILTGTLCIALAMGVFRQTENADTSAPAAAQTPAQKAPIVLKISNGVNESHPSYLAGLEFKRILESKLPGKYDVQVYANAQLGTTYGLPKRYGWEPWKWSPHPRPP